jgi:hypothetical protein
MRARWHRRFSPMNFAAAIDAAVLLTLIAVSVVARLYWPENYLADIALPLALILLSAVVRWG